MDKAEVTIDAPAEAVYDLVSDISNMGRWSPETYKVEWLDGATKPEPGARFKGSNRIKVAGFLPSQWSTTGVVREVEPGRVFSFDVPFSGSRWTYRFEPNDSGGCTVTETREIVDQPWTGRLTTLLVGWFRTDMIVKGMQTTLERVKAAAEAG